MSLWPVIPPLFSVGFYDIGFHDAEMIYIVNVKVPNGRTRLASYDAHNEENDTKGFRIG